MIEEVKSIMSGLTDANWQLLDAEALLDADKALGQALCALFQMYTSEYVDDSELIGAWKKVDEKRKELSRMASDCADSSNRNAMKILSIGVLLGAQVSLQPHLLECILQRARHKECWETGSSVAAL